MSVSNLQVSDCEMHLRESLALLAGESAVYSVVGGANFRVNNLVLAWPKNISVYDACQGF